MLNVTEASLSNNVTRAASPISTANAGVAMRSAFADMPFTTLTPADGTKFAENNTSWNLDVCKYEPAMMVQPETTAHVSMIVEEVTKHGARLVIAGGRHGHDCLAGGAVVLDLSKMKRVHVDTERRLVTVEGGCKLGDMDRACRPHGLACVTGTNPDTGVVGLSTAGGGGYLTRQHGMAVDNFVSATVVLASGETVTATKDNEHAELLWGLQGAGSNFGVVTELTMRAHPVDHVFGGMVINVAPTCAAAKTVLTNWRDWLLSAPRSVMSMAVLPCGAPVVPMAVVETDQAIVPQGADGARVTARQIPSLAGELSGPLPGPLGNFGASFGAWASIRQLGRVQYHFELQPLLESVQASGHYYDASCLVPCLSTEVIATLVEFTRVQQPNSSASIIIFPMGGAVADVPEGATSFYGGGRRADGFWIIIEGKWEPDAAGKQRDAVVGWVKRLRAALADFDVSDTAHTLDGNMESDLAGPASIFGPNLARLQEVKAKYDPGNFFKCNRNVPPAGLA